jgi:gliding motility-associated-like protein
VFVDTIDVSCFGREDGRASVLATGGYGNSYTFLWSDGGDSTSVRTDLAPGTYGITVVDDADCSVTQSFSIGSPEDVTVDAGPDITLPIGQDTILNPVITGLPVPSVAAGIYTWTPNTGLNCGNCLNPAANPLDTTVYTLTVDINGCIYSDSLQINVSQDHIYFVPNAFSPNGDGHNDLFMITAFNVRKLEYRIFDRWGNLVFSGHDIKDSWDGTYKGKEANEAVYVYTVYIEYLDRYNFRSQGSITLMR